MRHLRSLCISTAAWFVLFAPQAGGAADPLALEVRPAERAQTLAVRGTGPAGDAIVITLSATFDRDLPDVVLSRTRLTIGPNGAYAATISTAPAHTPRAELMVVVDDAASGGRAVSRIPSSVR